MEKTAVVTGSSSGIGMGIAQLLAKKNCRLVLISRDNKRGREIYESLCAQTSVDFYPTDLSNMRSVTETATRIAIEYPSIDALFNIAGQVLFTREETVEGLEMMFATNYLSHFILSNKLLPNLRKSWRWENNYSIWRRT